MHAYLFVLAKVQKGRTLVEHYITFITDFFHRNFIIVYTEYIYYTIYTNDLHTLMRRVIDVRITSNRT